jgi:hypothetical protein
MTDTTTTPTTSLPQHGPQRWFVGVLAVVVAAALAAWGTFSGDGGITEYVLVVAISVVAAVIVFGGVLPRTERSGMYARNGIILSGLAILSVFIFWTGLPPILGIAGLYLGAQQRNSLGLAAVALGALAVFGDVVIYVVDMT